MKHLSFSHARYWVVTACFFTYGVANAVSPTPGERAATHTANAEKTPAVSTFSRPSPTEISSPTVLRAYLRTKDEVRNSHYTQKTNRFCFVKQAPRPEVEGDTANVWMIWQEGGEILNSAGAPGRGDDATALGRSEALAKSIKLATGVVESQEQIAGSTFLVHRAWVNNIVSNCTKIGRTLTVPPQRRGGH